MRVDGVPHRTWLILLATSLDAISLKKRELQISVDGVAGNGLADIARQSPRHRMPVSQETKEGAKCVMGCQEGYKCVSVKWRVTHARRYLFAVADARQAATLHRRPDRASRSREEPQVECAQFRQQHPVENLGQLLEQPVEQRVRRSGGRRIGGGNPVAAAAAAAAAAQ